jgi:ribosomal protein L40E
MKKCPYCGHENVDEARSCLICHSDLDPNPSMPPDSQAGDPTLSIRVVANFANVVDADVFKTRLEAAGIDAFIPEEYTPNILWTAITNPLEGVTVRVAAKDYDAAKALYESAEASAAVPPPIPQSNIGTSAIGEGAAEQAVEKGPTRLCVACNAKIPENAGKCPKCGWTQPEG